MSNKVRAVNYSKHPDGDDEDYIDGDNDNDNNGGDDDQNDGDDDGTDNDVGNEGDTGCGAKW